MIEVGRDVLRACIAEASLAPSVHNIQPTRWRAAPGGIALLADASRRLPVADPTGRDVMISHGAALEGLDIALRQCGLCLGDPRLLPESETDARGLVAVAALSYGQLAAADDRFRLHVNRRASWRGSFRSLTPETFGRLDGLAAACPDMAIVTDRAEIDAVARLNDEASLHFLRDPAHRAELLAWMRLSRSDPRYLRDGLNREALALGAVEAWGARQVLGPLFGALDRCGLAGQLLSEGGKTRSAAAIAMLHRPAGEHALATGRAFYRAWLAIAAAGLAACPMSVLADWDEARGQLARRHPLPGGRQLVNVLRIGVPTSMTETARARLPVDELLL